MSSTYLRVEYQENQLSTKEQAFPPQRSEPYAIKLSPDAHTILPLPYNELDTLFSLLVFCITQPVQIDAHGRHIELQPGTNHALLPSDPRGYCYFQGMARHNVGWITIPYTEVLRVISDIPTSATNPLDIHQFIDIFSNPQLIEERMIIQDALIGVLTRQLYQLSRELHGHSDDFGLQMNYILTKNQVLLRVVNYVMQQAWHSEPLELLSMGRNPYNRDEKMVTIACEMMQDTFGEALSIDQLCAQLDVSRTRFFGIFKSQMKMTPADYLNKIRLDQAKRLLKQSDSSLLEIAYACGFKRDDSFIRFFKRNTGISPLRYRRTSHPL